MKVGSSEPGAAKHGMATVRALDLGVLEVGTPKMGLLKLSRPEAGLTEVGRHEVRSVEVGIPKPGPPEFSQHEIGPLKGGCLELSCLAGAHLKLRPGEIGPPKSALTKKALKACASRKSLRVRCTAATGVTPSRLSPAQFTGLAETATSSKSARGVSQIRAKMCGTSLRASDQCGA